MFALSLLVSAALAPFVLGQNTSQTLAIEAIEANFNNSGIVPSLLATFAPTAVMTLSFQGTDGAVAPGQAFTDNTKVAPTPNLTITGGQYSATDLFTLAMVDAGPVGTDETKGQTRHWLVNGVTVTGDAAPFTVSIENGTAITEYAGPAPPANSGPHRYVIMLYSQPSSFQAPAGLNTANIGVSTYDFPAYVQDSHLGALVAATYFTVEAGTASFTPSATSAVVTSTLPAAASSAGSSATSSSSGSRATGSPTAGQNGSTSLSISLTAVFAAIAAVIVFN
ncbi:hypothetical protein EUX98_g1230 [Antrodiella citrinella]|uniref:PEBP-like protein n=1 Tax=Antrodiella citrinella TaxID=2447956 RepID=A0A4S4N4H6_9APHY|nr:hypothetical protein EUX98_g1230 [Antrodiella citrinella]